MTVSPFKYVQSSNVAKKKINNKKKDQETKQTTTTQTILRNKINKPP